MKPTLRGRLLHQLKPQIGPLLRKLVRPLITMNVIVRLDMQYLDPSPWCIPEGSQSAQDSFPYIRVADASARG